MFALPISMPRFKSIILFYQNSPKSELFFQTNAKFSSFQRLGALPQTPKTPPPPCEFLAMRLLVVNESNVLH